MDQKKPLSIRQAKIVRGKVQGKTHQELGPIVFPNATPESARVMISKELNKITVKEALQQAMEKLNLTPERILKPIDDALDDDDVRTRMMGTDRALKVLQMTSKEEPTNTNIFIGNNFTATNYVED